ncbi:LytR/AlgR family response regulator transcription factor [Roseivirga sp.]|uniref:LytR/AlgR family response regulator transcription factor n=1 Tax=Roseivirga sp. TaxID=1964215 RepID=UPI003B52C671
MRVLIIEDEAPAFRRLHKILEELIPYLELIDVLDSVESAVQWFGKGERLDVAFMDIQLSDGLSFEIFEQCNVPAPVIFTTAFDEYLLNAFKVNGIDYLLKPIKPEELRRSLIKLEQLRSIFSVDKQQEIKDLISSIQLTDKQYKSRFLVRQGSKLLSVPSEDVACFHIKSGVLFLQTFTNERLIMDQTMDEISRQLDPKQFFRANRQFLINFRFIRSVEKYFKGKLLIKTSFETDEPVTVSEEKATEFKKWLDQ